MRSIGFALVAVINTLLFYVPLEALDPSRREKRGHVSLRVAVVAGAVGSLVFTPLFLLAGLLWSGTEELTTPFLAEVLLTGQVEELAKFLCCLFVLKRMRAYREPLDAALHAAAVGLGFSVVENLFYGADYGIGIQMGRVFTCTPGHMVYCVIVAVYWAGQQAGQWSGAVWRSPAAVFLVLIPSATFHGTYNYLLSRGRMGLALLLDLGALVVAARLVQLLRASSPYRAAPATPARDLAASGSGLRQALKRDPSSPLLNRRLAEAELRLRRWNHAIGHLDRCLAMDPGNVEVRALRASALIAGGEIHRGTRELEHAALATGFDGRKRLERMLLRSLAMRTPANTPRSHLSSRYLIISTLRTAGGPAGHG